MENKTSGFTVGKIILLITYLLIGINVLGYFEIINESSFLNGFAYGTLIGLMVTYIQDMHKNNVYNKRFWIMSIIILPLITAPVYLIQRNKLIRLGDKLKRGRFFEKSNA